MSANPTDPLALVQRVAELAAQLIERNEQLEAQVDDLQDHIAGLTTKLSAAQAAAHTLNQDANAALQQEQAAAAQRDTQRLERLRAELNDYLRDIDRRLTEATPHGDPEQ